MNAVGIKTFTAELVDTNLGIFGLGKTKSRGELARAPNTNDQLEKARWLKVLEGDRARMLFMQPFTANLSYQLELRPVLDSRLSTAATDGRSIFFSIEFLSCLSESDRLFVFAHEIWHAVAGHFIRRYQRDPRLWNLATDHEVNSILSRDGFGMPFDAVYFKDYDGHSAERVYNALVDKTIQPFVDQFQFDDHDPSAGLKSRDKGEGEAEVIDPDFNPVSGDTNLAREWTERLVQVHQQMKSHGTLASGLSHLIDRFLTPQVPWNQVLRKFMRNSYAGEQRDWKKCSRRHLHRGLWLPGLRGGAIKVVVAVDTSGSTSRVWGKFIAEVVELLGEFDRCELTLIECDVEITRIRHFHSWDDLSDLNQKGIKGGGGTDLRPPFKHADLDRPDALIYLTDGFGEVMQDAPGYPVLWVLTKDGQAPANWGEVVPLEYE